MSDDHAFPGYIVRIWQRCAMAAAVAVVLGGCGAAADLVEAEPSPEPSPSEPSPSPSPSEPSPSPTPTQPAVTKPKLGECRRIDALLTTLGADTDERRTVPCGKVHNAQTYHVGLMNKPMQTAAKGGNAAQLRREASQLCRRKLAGWLGGSKEDAAVSAFRFIVGGPSQADANAGARWFTCDAYATRVANDFKLAALPANTRGILKSKKAEAWSLCNRGNFKGGTTNLVICTRPHTYRAIAGIRLGGPGAKYPGPKRMDRSLEQACDDPVRAYLGVPGGFSYAWTYPGRQDWNDGNHWGLCYIKSKS